MELDFIPSLILKIKNNTCILSSSQKTAIGYSLFSNSQTLKLHFPWRVSFLTTGLLSPTITLTHQKMESMLLFLHLWNQLLIHLDKKKLGLTSTSHITSVSKLLQEFLRTCTLSSLVLTTILNILKMDSHLWESTLERLLCQSMEPKCSEWPESAWKLTKNFSEENIHSESTIKFSYQNITTELWKT